VLHVSGWTQEVERALIATAARKKHHVAIVDLFSDPFLREQLRFRGGTALNKLHFPAPIRYSEDIDLVRTSTGPIKPAIDRVRERLGAVARSGEFRSQRDCTKTQIPGSGGRSRGGSVDSAQTGDQNVGDRGFRCAASAAVPRRQPLFAGEATIPTFSRAEMLATKLRALLQRNKERDLFDLSHALDVFDDLDKNRIIECFRRYLEKAQTPISRAEAEQRMFAKLNKPGFLTDLRPLLAAEQAAQLTVDSVNQAFAKVLFGLITLIPGGSWARTDEMAERFGISI
jgi:predicted nucleotidyltransferase component of viral defense system